MIHGYKSLKWNLSLSMFVCESSTFQEHNAGSKHRDEPGPHRQQSSGYHARCVCKSVCECWCMLTVTSGLHEPSWASSLSFILHPFCPKWISFSFLLFSFKLSESLSMVKDSIWVSYNSRPLSPSDNSPLWQSLSQLTVNSWRGTIPSFYKPRACWLNNQFHSLKKEMICCQIN